MLISYAWRIVKEHDDAVMALSKPALRGVIRFGSPEPYTTGVLPRLLARFASSYPEVRVEMRCENSDSIKRAVDEGKLDIGLCTQIHKGGTES
jgi:DNA-binding transcriptional LysR family regulator